MNHVTAAMAADKFIARGQGLAAARLPYAISNIGDTRGGNEFHKVKAGRTNFFGGDAKQLAKPSVNQFKLVVIEEVNGVIRLFDQAAVELLGFSKGCFSALVLANIHDHRKKVGWLSLGIADK